jgi:predicted O-methyltransferase YrrM
MTTLTTDPVAPLLARLFAETDAESPLAACRDLPEAELQRLMRSKTDYRDLYGRLKDLALPVSRGAGILLYMLARTSRARTIVEFGTSFGISTIHLAGDLPDAIDLVLLDGAKALYSDILALLEPHLRPGAAVVADNADYSPDYLARVRAPASGYLSMPFDDNVELSVWTGR